MSCGGYTPFFNADAQVPVAGQICTNAIPRMPFAMKNPVLGYIGGVLTVCAQLSVNWACTTLNNAIAPVWSATLTSVSEHRNAQGVFDSAGGRIIVCDDNPDNNVVTEAFTNAWASNIYPKPLNKNGPGQLIGCFINNEYLYFLAVNYFQRIRRIGLATNTWEPLGDGLSNIAQARIFKSPFNGNQIVITSQNSPDTPGSYRYILIDLFTLIRGFVNINSIFNLDGVDYTEMCAASPINLVATGSGYSVFTPSTPVTAANPLLSTSGTWNAITGVSPPTRCYGTCIRAPPAAYITVCGGC